MRFKSHNQRKAVMAKLNSPTYRGKEYAFPWVSGVGYGFHRTKKEAQMSINKFKKMNYTQLKKKGVKLIKKGDIDKDGVPNIKDCKPLDKKRQGLIHDFIKKKNEFVKRRNKKLEQKQDALLRDIDNEKTKLAKTRVVQKRIMENQKLKEELSSLKKANFAQTRTGKIIAATTSPKVKKAAKKFLKKIFN